jgi:integrase
LRRLLQAGDEGRHVAPDKITLKEWISQWIAAGAPNGRKRKKTVRTIERYGQLLQRHVAPTLGDTQLQKLIATDIDRLYAKLAGTMAERTLHHVHVVLGASLREAARKKLITTSPMISADVPEVGESDHGMALDEAQLAKLVQCFKGSPLYPIIAVAAYTGMRLREITALQWSDLSFEKRTLKISRAVEETKAHGRKIKGPKTERGERTIELDAGLIELLAAQRERHLRLVAGIPDRVTVDLSLVKLPAGALVFPGGDGTNLTKLRGSFTPFQGARPQARIPSASVP